MPSKKLFDQISLNCSKFVVKKYSTSFSIAITTLPLKIRSDIYNIYAFVRFADEIVDSFHDYNQATLLKKFKDDYQQSLQDNISLNPIINSFQKTVKDNAIDPELIAAFFESMQMDLHKKQYKDKKELTQYIYGSAEVIGLMCLKILVNKDEFKYKELINPARSLGAAYQKVNFLRDLKKDYKNLGRFYFSNLDFQEFNDKAKAQIIEDIKKDFNHAYNQGILKLDYKVRFAVYISYIYYQALLAKIDKTKAAQIMNKRIRISNIYKIILLIKSYFLYKLRLI